MDLSKWGEYSPDNRQQLLGSIAAVLSSKRMPPPRYTLLHPEARLSDAEVQVLYQWARTERRRVKAALNAPSAAQ
jgi:cytochrome c